VLLYDTKHGTNRYGVKLGCLTSFDQTGKTQVLAASLILHEDEESFTWVFKCFSESFQRPPVVVFTDSDLAMDKAIPLAWPEAVHLLCTFHLFKNFFENMRPLFVNRKDDWQVAASLWWKLCKTSDAAMRERFPDEWDALTNRILNGATVNEKGTTEKETLVTVHEREGPEMGSMLYLAEQNLRDSFYSAS
jgi:transposase-like protein